MAFNFPPNPSVNDTWTVGTKTYYWSGSAWLIYTQAVAADTLTISNPTNATSTNSGALQIVGGVGIGGDLWLGGTLYSNSQPVITTATLNASVFGGTDIEITSTGTSSTTFLRFDNTSTLQSVTGRGYTSTNLMNIANPTESSSTTTGALTVLGGLGVGRRINCESLKILDAVLDSTLIQVNTTASTVIDSYLLSDFRSAKYFVQIGSGGDANNSGSTATFQAVELILLADNNNNVYATQYGLVSTSGSSLGAFQADLSIIDNTVRLYFAATTATNKTIKVLRTGMAS